jgi:hypothetical protein
MEEKRPPASRVFLFQNGKGAHEVALGSRANGPLEDAASPRWPIVRVGWRLD